MHTKMSAPFSEVRHGMAWEPHSLQGEIPAVDHHKLAWYPPEVHYLYGLNWYHDFINGITGNVYGYRVPLHITTPWHYRAMRTRTT